MDLQLWQEMHYSCGEYIFSVSECHWLFDSAAIVLPGISEAQITLLLSAVERAARPQVTPGKMD